MVDLTKGERKELDNLKFYEVCESIKQVRGFPLESSDREYAQQVSIRDLLSSMLACGFAKLKARKLIAEASDTPEHLVRQWTRYVHLTKMIPDPGLINLDNLAHRLNTALVTHPIAPSSF